MPIGADEANQDEANQNGTQPAAWELSDRILAALQELHQQDPTLLHVEMRYYHARRGQDWRDSSWSSQPS